VVGVVRRAGIGLAEVAVAVGLFALVGVALFSMLSGGATATARAGEMELASTLGARVVDRLLADGYRALAPYAGRGGDIDLSRMGDAGDAPLPVPGALVLDGLAYRAKYRLQRAREGLLQLAVTLSWRRSGLTASRQDGSLTLIRFVADPQAAGSAREAFQ
jgi:hypothetical protein